MESMWKMWSLLNGAQKKMSHCQQERKEQCLLPMSVQPASQYKMKTIVELFFFFLICLSVYRV